MPITFQFYDDIGLTTPTTSITATQATTGSAAAVDRVVYLGSTVPLVYLLPVVNPYVDPVTVSLTDSALGSGVQASHVKLATTQAGLDSATAGAPCDLGLYVLSEETATIWLRIDTPALADGVYTDLTLTTNDVDEIENI